VLAATVHMNHTTDAVGQSWQSEALEDGQRRRFCVRIATAVWPAGIETDNTHEQSAIPNFDAAGMLQLSERVV
jgi:hypothetical protein